jgi:hypothetical protein
MQCRACGAEMRLMQVIVGDALRVGRPPLSDKSSSVQLVHTRHSGWGSAHFQFRLPTQ